ncbi:PTS sugar transporter subunit IIA [Paraburkholderia rhizosphaerae]|uniref:PTS system nitrogen regulatory IIA component n=1 Tax=Paraburkholderia rhizosphaerae TaxID=480658 RepID=A0A4R8LW10_9BURK|nr:PTS sugar transporter subunit IIA [Paraburkholderia rhizosphaerae]TDY50876.1 PTS system nitrogen regulatory IIA component [Paraburkholderia rhizosphaerae]
MAHPLAGLRALLKRSRPENRAENHTRSGREPGRNVMLHVTVDAQHTTPFREALIRDCGNQQWTLRVAPLRDSGRVRLSLYLPKADVGHAMRRLSQLTPDAEVGQVVEIPDTPSDAWRSLIQAEAQGDVPRPKHAGARSADAVLTEPRDRSSRATDAQVAAAAAEAMIENILPTQPSLAQLLPASHVLLGLRVDGREQLFAQLSQSFETLGDVPAGTVTAGLASREALGSTGLGRGIAVPHGHIENLAQPMAIYARLAEPIAFDAPDGQPVSDVVALLVPQWADSAHLHLLAEVAQCFCDHQFRDRLHECVDPAAVCRLFSGRETLEHAARGNQRLV